MNITPHIGINGLFLRKPGTGIGQVTRFFLEEFQKKNTDGQTYNIYVDDPGLVSLGSEQGRVVYVKPWWERDDLIRKFLWEYVQLPRQAVADGITHFLSLYQVPTKFSHRIRHVMVVHDIIPEFFPEYQATLRSRFVWYMTKSAIQQATALVTVSASTKKDIEQGFSVPAEKISLAYPSINPLFFQELQPEAVAEVLERYQLAPGYLYHGGGLELRKNTESVLTAYAAWREARGGENIPILVISGFIHDQANPFATDVRGLLKKFQLETVVHLLGFVPDEHLPALYNQASLFVFPSRYEGFGMPVVEALSQGTAVVAEKNSSLGEVGGESVLWVEELTKESLEASYQQALASSSEEKAVRILQAKNFASWSSFVQKITETMLQ